MNLVATRWWSMFFMPSCLLVLGIGVGAAWTLKHETNLWRAIERGVREGAAFAAGRAKYTSDESRMAAKH
jgi:hypothetical protein